MDESQKATAIKAFLDWEVGLDFDTGDHPEDYTPWLECFLAGYQAALDEGKGGENQDV